MKLLQELLAISSDKLSEDLSKSEISKDRKQFQTVIKNALAKTFNKAAATFFSVPDTPGNYNKPAIQVDGLSLKNDGLYFNVTCLSQGGAELGDDFAVKTSVKIAKSQEFLVLLSKDILNDADSKEISRVILKTSTVVKTEVL